jgi:hypothetical protein
VATVEDMLGRPRGEVPPELLFSHERRFKGPF